MLSSIIINMNTFFVRKDIDYLQYLEPLIQITQAIGSAPQFAKEANKAKNSILNLVKDFLATSYFENCYMRWTVCFMRDGIDQDLFKDIIEEIGMMMSRLKSAIGNDFIADKSLYSKFLSIT